MVRVEDARAHCEHARAHGATILMEPTDFEYGERQYSAEDPAGHRWTFTQTLRDTAPKEWGGIARNGAGERSAGVVSIAATACRPPASAGRGPCGRRGRPRTRPASRRTRRSRDAARRHPEPGGDVGRRGGGLQLAVAPAAGPSL